MSGAGGASAGGGTDLAALAPAPAAAPALKDFTYAPATAAPAAVPIASQPTLAQHMVRSDLTADKVNSAAKKTGAPLSEVLASFQIERNGQQIRILDADGSIYQGQVADQVVVEKAASANNFGVANNGNAGGPASNGSQLNFAQMQDTLMGGFNFQVSGVNRSLNQTVTLTGSFFSAPLQQYANALGNGGALNLSPAQNGLQTANALTAPAQNQQQWAANNYQNVNVNVNNNSGQQNFNNGGQQNGMARVQVWRVTGRVQVGPTNQFDLDAVTLQP